MRQVESDWPYIDAGNFLLQDRTFTGEQVYNLHLPMTTQLSDLKFIASIKSKAFPNLEPGQLGLFNETILPEMRGPRGEIWTLGGLEYSLVIEGIPGDINFGIKHHFGDNFLLSLSPPGYTYMMRPVLMKNLHEEVLLALKHAKKLGNRK